MALAEPDFDVDDFDPDEWDWQPNTPQKSVAGVMTLKTLDDRLKHSHLIKVWDKYTLAEIEAALPE